MIVWLTTLEFSDRHEYQVEYDLYEDYDIYYDEDEVYHDGIYDGYIDYYCDDTDYEEYDTEDYDYSDENDDFDDDGDDYDDDAHYGCWACGYGDSQKSNAASDAGTYDDDACVPMQAETAQCTHSISADTSNQCDYAIRNTALDADEHALLESLLHRLTLDQYSQDTSE